MYQRRPNQLSTLRSFWNVEFFVANTREWRMERERKKTNYAHARAPFADTAATLANGFLIFVLHVKIYFRVRDVDRRSPRRLKAIVDVI